MVVQTASRNGGGGSTSSTPPSSARHAPASSPFGGAALANAAADAPAKTESSVDRTPPRNAPPSARRPWRVPPQLASIAPAAASLYHQLMSGVGGGRGGGGSDGGGGLASWAGLASSSSSSPSRRGGRRSSGQVFRAAVGNSRVAHAVRSNKRAAAAGLALLAVVVLVSSSSGSGGGRRASSWRSLVADRDNSQELDAATLAELAALDAGQGGGIRPDSQQRRASPTAADLPGTASQSALASATDLAVKALDRAELAGLVQSTGFFSPDEAEAVVDAVSKGDLDSAELLKAIDEEKAKQAQEEQKASSGARAAAGDASGGSATSANKAKAVAADEVDDWFFDDLDDGGDDDDDDFFFGDEEEDGLGRGRGARAGAAADDDDLFFDDDEEAEDAFGFGGGGSSRGGGRKGAPAGRRAGGARASSSSSTRRSSSSSSSPRRASATVSRRGGGSVLDDDFEDEEASSIGGGRGGGGGRRSRGSSGTRSRSSRSRSSRPVDLNDDGGDELLLEDEDDARLFGDVDGGFDDEFDDVPADGGLPTRRSGGARQFAKDDFADDEVPVRRGGAGVAGRRKASPAAKKASMSSPRNGGRNTRRGPALADDFDDDFAEDGIIDGNDAALFGDDEFDEGGDALFVDEDDDGLLGDDNEPLFSDEVGGGGGGGAGAAVGGRRSKGAAAAGSAATTAGKKNSNIRPGQKKNPLHQEPDFRSGGAKAPLVGAARARGSSSDLTKAAAVGGAGGSRSNDAALPNAAATLDSRTKGRPASGTEDLDATAAANPLPRKLITSDLITMRNDDDDMTVSGDSVALASETHGNGSGKENRGDVAGVAATHENIKSEIATADAAAVAAQNDKMKRTAVAVTSGLASLEANDADAAAAGAEGGGRASSSSSEAAARKAASSAAATKTKTAAATSSTPPVVVALANRFYFGERYARIVPGCTWRGGASLPCEFTSDQARLADADAIAFHIPGMSKEMLDAAARTRRREQALVGVSMESAPNYPLLADREFLGRFDLLATLVPPGGRVGSPGGVAEEDSGASSSSPSPKRVWYPYYDDMFRRCWEAEGNPASAFLMPAEAAAAGGGTRAAAAAGAAKSSKAPPSKPSLHPSHLRENALAYVNSNCATKIGRDALVKAMMEVLEPLGVPLRSFGRCLNNMPRSARADTKIDTLRRYKFCVAVENSEMPHYVTEKIFDSLVAGCVPVYFGAPDVLDYIPHRDAIIDVRALGGARAAAEEVARLASDDAAYARKHAWRDDPESWSPRFKELEKQSWRDGAGPFEKCELTWTVDSFEISDPHMRRQCAICREVAEFQDKLV